MAWRIVKQPNGLLARFSDVVDNFTHANMSEREAYRVCRRDLGVEESKRKVRAGLEDWPPWTVETIGSGHDRWDDSLDTIKSVHGEGALKRVLDEIG